MQSLNLKMEKHQVLIELFKLILNSRHFPSQWNLGLIKNIHGNNDGPNNYRGITLNSTLG